MTAHPKIDPVTGEMHFFGYGFVPPFLTYHVVAADGTLRHSDVIELPGPVMIHDFAITERDAVFWVLPVVFCIEDAIKSVQGDEAVFPFRWDPSYGSRVGIMPLGGAGSSIRWVDIDPCYVFHGTNAFRDGDDVVLDVCRLPSAFSDTSSLEPSALHRWTISTAGAELAFSDQTLSEEQMDLPSIDRRYTGRRNRYGYYAAFDGSAPGGLDFAGVNRLDHDRGVLDRWEPGSLYRAGEVVFVPGGTSEGDGWLLTFAYDRSRDTSDMIVLDATDVTTGPVAQVHLPTRVPYGFHGTWVPA
jgi:carotenoid cleavage dioxygenase